MEALRKHAFMLTAFLWGVAEATLFFIVPDVILSYIGVRQGPRAAAKASLIAAFGAATGGVVMYLWSWGDPAAALAAVAAVPAISAEMIGRAREAMGGDWFAATLLGPLTSTPYKVYAILAPESGVPLAGFALASVVARLPRFLAVGIGVAALGAWLRARAKLPERAVLGLLGLCWIAFYILFFSLMPA